MSFDPETTRVVRSWLDEGVTQLPDRVLDAVLEQVPAIPQRQAARRPVWRTPAMNRFSVGVVAAALLVAVAVGIQALGLNNTGVVPGPTATAEPSPADPTAVPTASARASADTGDFVDGWPSTRKNAAGTYSWNGNRCAGDYCIVGFMHNGYGSGDVEIRIDYRTGSPTPDDGVRVTVAGHDGIYRRIDARREEWIVDIEGATVGISLTAEPGTNEADLDEAHAIIDSMRTEATDVGFRIVFTLTTGDWDSG